MNIQRQIIIAKGRDVIVLVRQLIRLGQVNRILVRRGDKVLLDLPLTVIGVGIILSPILAGAGLMFSLIQECCIEVYTEND